MTKEEIKILQEQSLQNDRYNSLVLSLRVAFDEIQRLHSDQAVLEEKIRSDERQKCWEEVAAAIAPGDLPGDGTDRTAERNGLIKATNIIVHRGIRRKDSEG